MSTFISLNGLWDFVVDLDPKYHQNRNYAKPNWDRRHWKRVSVPGVWNKYAERYDIFEGVGWFAREFALEAVAPDTTCLLRFGGVNYLCEVFVNGVLVGTHEGGYNEFVVDVSRSVHVGTNHIAVRVDNRALNMKLPPVLGYFNYGGIHRDVILEVHPTAYIADINFNCEPADSGGTLRAWGRVAKPTNTKLLQITCKGQTTSAMIETDGRFDLTLNVIGVDAWSPDHPALYNARVEVLEQGIACDTRAFEIGFRTITTRGTQIELNGQPLDLRGVCYLYDSPTHGLVVQADQFEVDLQLLRKLGANAIRSHFSFPHAFLAACDRAGIIVWVEPPVYCIDPKLVDCRTAFSDPTWRDLALQMVEEMIHQSKWHPCVCIYGIGNECQLEAPGATEFFRALAARAKSLDSTRLLSYACLYGLAGEIADIVDIVGFNEYWGWYDILFQSPAGETGKPVSTAYEDAGAWTTPPARAEVEPRKVELTKLEEMLARQGAVYGKPILLTEFGADSIPGYRSGTLELWSEDYHAKVIEETLAIAERMPFVCGTFPFVFADYRDPSKEIDSYWDELNYKGVVSYSRREKVAYWTLQAAYARRRVRQTKVA